MSIDVLWKNATLLYIAFTFYWFFNFRTYSSFGMRTKQRCGRLLGSYNFHNDAFFCWHQLRHQSDEALWHCCIPSALVQNRAYTTDYRGTIELSGHQTIHWTPPLFDFELLLSIQKLLERNFYCTILYNATVLASCSIYCLWHIHL